MDFVRFCFQCAFHGHLNLDDEALICLYEECLVLALHLQDLPIQLDIYLQLGPLYLKLCRHGDAIKCCEKLLNFANIHMLSSKVQVQVRMKAFLWLGESYYFIAEVHKSLECCQKGLNAATEIGDKSSEVTANLQLGRANVDLGKYYKGIECLDKSLHDAVQMGDRFSEGKSHGCLGDAYKALGKYQEAILHYEKEIEISIETGDKSGEGGGYNGLGQIHVNQGEYHKAIDYHEKHLKIAQEMRDKVSEAAAYSNLGTAYDSLSEYHKAINCFKKSLALRKNTGDKNGEGIAYLNMGVTYDFLAEFNKAMEYLKKALNIFLDTGNKEGENKSYINLGSVSTSLGRLHDSITYYKKALDIAVEIGDKNGQGTSTGNLGNVYMRLRRHDEALPYFKKSLDIAVEINDKYGEEIARGNIGTIYYLKTNFQESVKHYEQQLELAVEIGDKRGQRQVYEHLGTVLFSQGKYSDAIEHCTKSLTIAVEICDKQGEGQCYFELGRVYSSMGLFDKAIEYHKRCLNIAEENSSKSLKGNASTYLGGIYLKLGKDYKKSENAQDQEKHLDYIKKSEKYLRDAVQCWEWMFDHLQEQNRYKISIFEAFIEAYKQLTAVLLETKQFEEALLVSERGRARVLNDILVSKYDMSSQGNALANNSSFTRSADLHEFLTRCKMCVLFYAIESEGLLIWVLDHDKPLFCLKNEVPGIKNWKVLEKVINQAGIQNWNVLKKVIDQLITYAYQKINVADVTSCEDRSLDLLQNVNSTKEEDELLMNPYAEYHTNIKDESSSNLSEMFELMSLSTSQTDCTVRPGPQTGTSQRGLPEENMETQDDKSESLTNPQQAAQQEVHQDGEGSQGDKHPLELLFDLLVRPLLQSKLVQEEVVIIPEGPLYRVPFPALRDPSTGLYLSETTRIRLAPSLTALKVLKESPADYHSKKGALIVGNPDVGEVILKGERKTLPPLPSAEREVRAISYMLKVEPVTKSEATKAFVKQRLREGVAVIHIAAHGGANGEIALAPTKENQDVPEEQDYLLTMKEVQEIGVRAQLVVLSCCHSGHGNIWPEGVVGMSRAFLVAGARAVVASLWAISDNATHLFMIAFYRYLKNGESVSQCLQKAMKELREDEDYSEPKYWAPFFVIGDDVTINI